MKKTILIWIIVFLSLCSFAFAIDWLDAVDESSFMLIESCSGDENWDYHTPNKSKGDWRVVAAGEDGKIQNGICNATETLDTKVQVNMTEDTLNNKIFYHKFYSNSGNVHRVKGISSVTGAIQTYMTYLSGVNIYCTIGTGVYYNSISINTWYYELIIINETDNTINCYLYDNSDNLLASELNAPYSETTDDIDIIYIESNRFIFDDFRVMNGSTTQEFFDLEPSPPETDEPSISAEDFITGNINWTVQVESSEDGACTLNHNLTGTFAPNVTISVTADTPLNISNISFLEDTILLWGVNCSDATGNTNYTDNFTRAIDFISSDMDILFADENGVIKNLFDEGEEFIVTVNLTTNSYDFVLDENITHLYFLDEQTDKGEDTTNILDSSRHVNGSGIGDLTFNCTNEQVGDCSLDFDGVGDYVTMGLYTPPTAYSISVWINYKSISGTDGIVISHSGAVRNGIYLFNNGTGNHILWYTDSNGNRGIWETNVTIPNANEWFHFVGIQETPQVSPIFYINGNLSLTDEFLVTGTRTREQGELMLGSGTEGGGTYFNGSLDEVIIYNKILTAEEVGLIYSRGSNGTNTVTNDFQLAPVIDSVCNVSLGEGIIVNSYVDGNFTFCNSVSCDLSSPLAVNFTGLFTDSVVEDTIDLSICHEQVVNEDLVITDIQCGATIINETIITAASIPSCSDGEGFFRISLGTNCSTETHIQFNLESSAPFSQRHRIVELETDREYVIDSDSMVYNATTRLYEVTPFHFHEYYLHGLKNITAHCTNPIILLNNSRNETITIVNIPPQVAHTLIRVNTTLESKTEENYAFDDDIVVNISKNSNVSFFISVIDDDFTNVTHYLYNVGGIQIFNDTHTILGNDVHSISGSLLFSGRFNFTTVAFDSLGGNTTLSTLFNFTNITDTTIPSIVFYFPTTTNISTMYANESVTFIVQCNDVNLFQILGNVTLNTMEDFATGFKQNTEQPLDNLSITFTPNETSEVGESSFTIMCGDSGTGIYLSPSDFGYSSDNDTLTFTNYKDEFSFDISHSGSIPPFKDYKVNKLEDAYDWVICLSSPATAKTWTITEYIDGDFFYLENSEYTGHFVSADGKTWIRYVDEDWNNQKVIDVVKTKSNQWAITTEYPKEILCHSPLTGSTNTVTEAVTFEVLARPEASGLFFSANVCPDADTPTVLMTALIFIVLVTMFVLGRVYIKFPVIDMLVGVGMMIFGGAIVGCNFIIGIVVILFGIIMFIMAFI